MTCGGGGEGCWRTHLFVRKFSEITNGTFGVDYCASYFIFSLLQLVEVLHYKTVELDRTSQHPDVLMGALGALDLIAIRQLLTQGSLSTSCRYLLNQGLLSTSIRYLLTQGLLSTSCR